MTLSGAVVWLVAALAVGIAFRLLGVLFPKLGILGSVVSRAPRGRDAAPAIALTFDDGPDPDTTPRILEILRQERCAATFFVIGRKAAAHPELLQQMVEDGHNVGIHGYRHDRLHSLRSAKHAYREIQRTQDVIRKHTGSSTRWFRPPIGHASPATFRAASMAGVDIVLWSARAVDGYKGARSEDVLRRLKRGLSPGGILMLHDASERGDFAPVSAAVLGELIREGRARGFLWVNLETLLRQVPSTGQDGGGAMTLT